MTKEVLLTCIKGFFFFWKEYSQVCYAQAMGNKEMLSKGSSRSDGRTQKLSTLSLVLRMAADLFEIGNETKFVYQGIIISQSYNQSR